MKKIILSSHGFQKNSMLKEQISELLPKEPKNLSVAIITTASAEWKEKNKHAVLAKEVFEEMGFKEVVFLDVEFEDPNKLKDFDLIYINGGNPFYLLHQLRRSGADKILRECAEKSIIIGISAGAVVLGPNISIVNYFDSKLNSTELKDFTALNLTDLIIYPHYNEEMENKIKGFELEFNCKVERLLDDKSIMIKIKN